MLSLSCFRCKRRVPVTVLPRSFATEVVQSPPPQPPPLPTPGSTKTRASLYLRPRPAAPTRPQEIPALPPNFGLNQLLSVPNDTRTLLESIVSQFNAPIRYAFAYGSGVFEQDGYTRRDASESPMLDFIFAVTHPSHFHSINMQQYPNHYPLHARLLGSSYISNFQALGPGLWFNAYVEMDNVKIKYGVTTIDNLCSDLLNWKTLYLAGRMHKPVRIIRDDARVRLTQQVNLISAVRIALLTLPAEFSEMDFFERIAGISYTGDPRMILPVENRGKIGNIVRKQCSQFKELYHRLAVGLPGVHWPSHSSVVKQDMGIQARSALLKKLPSNLLLGVKSSFLGNPEIPSIEADEAMYWKHLAKDEKLPVILTRETEKIVQYPATVQSIKGVASAGVGKSLRYGIRKFWQWYSGSR